MNFIIRAGLQEESNEGWVWMCGSNAPASRTIVKILNPENGRYIYTEVRKIDDNFCRSYNVAPRFHIDCSQNTMVMTWWYRNALGIHQTTEPDNKAGRAVLDVKKARKWNALNAACHHPDPVVRLGTRLGVLGAVLGLLGVWLGILSTWPSIRCLPWLIYSAWAALTMLTIASICACRGPSYSTAGSE